MDTFIATREHDTLLDVNVENTFITKYKVLLLRQSQSTSTSIRLTRFLIFD